MLDEAIELLPSTKLYVLAQKYLDLKRLRPDTKNATKRNLLADVKTFERASLAGEYYDSFDVNSKNFMEKSRGTTNWIAECRRLLDRCVTHAQTGDPARVCQAFGIIFGLLGRLDEGRDDVVFFTDEGGAWQVGVDWNRCFRRGSRSSGDNGARRVRAANHRPARAPPQPWEYQDARRGAEDRDAGAVSGAAQVPRRSTAP